MTRDEIMALAEKVGLTGLSLIDVAYLGRFAELVSALERESCIAAIQGQIDHAHINELRLVPRFGKRLGEIAVRADDLEATLDGIRARGEQ